VNEDPNTSHDIKTNIKYIILNDGTEVEVKNFGGYEAGYFFVPYCNVPRKVIDIDDNYITDRIIKLYNM